MSIIKSIKQVLGLGPAAENHFWDGSVPNQLTLKRGTPDAPGAEVLKVVNGKITVLANARSWVEPTRVLGTTYTNDTGQDIVVNFSGSINTTAFRFQIQIGSTVVAFSSVSTVANQVLTLHGIVVPAGETYLITQTGGTPTIDYWTELR